MSNNDKLAEIRNRIDLIDEQIQELITERARCAGEVAEVKQQSNEEVIFYRPEREADILRKVQSRNQGPLSNEEMARLFREIISTCLALEEVLKIAYLGPEGTFTQSAALKHFGHAVETMPLPAIDTVFREVESGSAHYGVVPVENSTEGVISHTLDMFLRTNMKICGEVELRVHHCLLSNERDKASIKKVYSHQQSLGQCREWLDSNLSQAERVAVSSNSEAARLAASEPSSAAIASDASAEIYKLKILQPNIEDEPDNTTRFLIIGKQRVGVSARDKTSLLLSTNNSSGALHGLLAPLVKHNISMTRIESRPSKKGMWDYVFFIDIEGHETSPEVSIALQELEQKAALFKVLGSYPCAVL